MACHYKCRKLSNMHFGSYFYPNSIFISLISSLVWSCPNPFEVWGRGWAGLHPKALTMERRKQFSMASNNNYTVGYLVGSIFLLDSHGMLWLRLIGQETDCIFQQGTGIPCPMEFLPDKSVLWDTGSQH